MADKVVIVRHGPAEMVGPDGTDMGRRLTPAGRETVLRAYAELFPSLLDDEGLPTGISVVAGPAARTVGTAEAICDVLGIPHDAVSTANEIWNQDPDAIEDIVRGDGSRVLVVVGHSPSIDVVAGELSGRMQMMVRGQAICIDMSARIGSKGRIAWVCRPR